METRSLQAEIRQTVPFRSLAQEAMIGLQRTASTLSRRFDVVLEPFGVTSQQYNVLRILRGARGPLPTLEIGERMIERTPGVTRLVDRLVMKGLAERRQCADDRRVVHCVITAAGLELLASLDGLVDEFDEQVAATLTPAELEQLSALLQRIRTAF